MAWLLLKASTSAIAIALASAILARDHGLLANRLIAAFFYCVAGWAGLEFLLHQQTDAGNAVTLMRWICLGWVPLGVLCMHASLAVSSMREHVVARLLPAFYLALAIVLPFAVGTDLVVAGAVPSRFGWRMELNPGMAVVYALVAAPIVVILASWREMMGGPAASGQRALARVVFFGVSGALAIGTLTGILLPAFGFEAIDLTTTIVTAVGLAGMHTLRQHGHASISHEAFAREILDTLEDGVVLVGEDGTIREVNRAFLRLVDSAESAVLGAPIARFLPDLPDHGRGVEAGAFLELRSKSGGSVPVVLSEPLPCHEAGHRVGQAFLLRDRREVLALKRQLLVSSRLAAVGDLSKPITRSIFDPVTRVRYQLEGLAVDWQTMGDVLELAGLDGSCHDAIDEGEELIGECIEGADRIFSIVREVRGFADESVPGDFDRQRFEEIVRRALRLTAPQCPAHVRVETRLDPSVEIECHAGDIERVVTNLIVNAIHAVVERDPNAGHIVVSLTGAAERACLHVEDDGCGIPPEVLDRVFDPFFTTKPVGQGTGLGLAISYHVVRAHGGEIRVASVPGQGTTVTVELPRAPQRVEEGEREGGSHPGGVEADGC